MVVLCRVKVGKLLQATRETLVPRRRRCRRVCSISSRDDLPIDQSVTNDYRFDGESASHWGPFGQSIRENTQNASVDFEIFACRSSGGSVLVSALAEVRAFSVL